MPSPSPPPSRFGGGAPPPQPRRDGEPVGGEAACPSRQEKGKKRRAEETEKQEPPDRLPDEGAPRKTPVDPPQGRPLAQPDPPSVLQFINTVSTGNGNRKAVDPERAHVRPVSRGQGPPLGDRALRENDRVPFAGQGAEQPPVHLPARDPRRGDHAVAEKD